MFYKSSHYSNSNRATYKELFRCLRTGLCSVLVCFFEFFTPFTLGAITFSFLIHFRPFLVCQMRQKEDFNFYLDTRNKEAFPGPVYPNIIVAFNMQLCWFMRFTMEFFYPICFSFQSNFGQYIPKCNNFQIPNAIGDE